MSEFFSRRNYRPQRGELGGVDVLSALRVVAAANVCLIVGLRTIGSLCQFLVTGCRVGPSASERQHFLKRSCRGAE